ncbi:MAG: hypothetical protein E6G65_11740 [Actinobacteria bacterium]|nr:MAG: hypothetical protein E6G65_11740 [Actinomycetota bacterium]
MIDRPVSVVAAMSPDVRCGSDQPVYGRGGATFQLLLSSARRSHQANPEQSNPERGCPPSAAGSGEDKPHSPPQT